MLGGWSSATPNGAFSHVTAKCGLSRLPVVLIHRPNLVALIGACRRTANLASDRDRGVLAHSASKGGSLAATVPLSLAFCSQPWLPLPAFSPLHLIVWSRSNVVTATRKFLPSLLEMSRPPAPTTSRTFHCTSRVVRALIYPPPFLHDQ